MGLATDVVSLLFKIDSDSSGVDKDVDRLGGVLSGGLGKIEGLFSKLGLPTGFFSQLEQVGSAAKSGLGAVTAEAGGATTSLGSLGAIAPVVVGGVAAIATGVIALTGACFGLATAAASADGEIWDLHQRTGVAVETLSAFRLAAVQSNTSLDEFAGGMRKFNQLIGQAAEGSKEAKEKLKAFGVEPLEALNNQQAALAKVFKTINELPEGIQRSIAAQEAFGKSGDRLVDMIQSVGGNLDEYMEKARQSGQVISTEAAAKADEYGDKLDALKFKFSEVTRKIGEELIPHIIKILDDLDSSLSTNGDSWRALGRTLGEFVSDTAAVIGAIRDVIHWLDEMDGSAKRSSKSFHEWLAETFKGSYAERGVDWVRSWGNDTSEWNRGTGQGPTRMEMHPEKVYAETKAKEEEEKRKAKEEQDKKDKAASFFTGKDHGGAEAASKAAKEAAANAEKDSRASIRLEEIRLQTATRVYRAISDAARLSYQDRLTSLADYVAHEKSAEEDLYQAKLRAITAERAELAKDRKLRPKEAEAKRAELDEREAAALADKNANIDRLDREAAQKQEQALRDKIAVMRRMMDEADAAHIESVKARIDKQAMTEEEGERLIIAIQLGALDRKREALDLEWKMAGEDVERKSVLTQEYAALEQQRAHFTEDAERRIEAAHRRDLEAARQRAADLRRARASLEDEHEQNDRAYLERLRRYSGDALGVIEESARLENEAEGRRHQRALDSLARERDELLEKAATKEEKLEIEEVFNRREEEEAQRHQLALNDIRDQTADDTDGLDPTSDRSFWGDQIADKLLVAEGRFQRFGAVAQNVFANLSRNAGNMGTILGSAFDTLAQGISQTVTNFVLLGTLGPNAIRKMTAQILAGVAAQAAVKAIFELAEGLAALANPFTAWQAPMHFAAAKTYGIVAGVAAIAGRVVAGNAFQSDARNDAGTPTNSRLAAGDRPGSGSSTSSGGSGSSSDDGDKTVVLEQGRRVVEVIVRHEPGMVVEHVVNDFYNNGQIRTIVNGG